MNKSFRSVVVGSVFDTFETNKYKKKPWKMFFSLFCLIQCVKERRKTKCVDHLVLLTESNLTIDD
jgi:hypothetical protein